MKCAVKEHSILFNADMVRAIRGGRKTQTRRVVNLKVSGGLALDHDSVFKIETDCNGDLCAWYRTGEDEAYLGDEAAYVKCPYGRPGDRLWVREGFAHVPVSAYRCSDVEQLVDPRDPDMAFVYRADWDLSAPSRWKPSIHMPRRACRLVLEVVSVRVERVKDIDPIDCFAEGCMPIDQWPSQKEVIRGMAGYGVIQSYKRSQSREVFADLWDSINAGRGFGWDANPWVWVVEFKVLEGGA